MGTSGVSWDRYTGHSPGSLSALSQFFPGKRFSPLWHICSCCLSNSIPSGPLPQASELHNLKLKIMHCIFRLYGGVIGNRWNYCMEHKDSALVLVLHSFSANCRRPWESDA